MIEIGRLVLGLGKLRYGVIVGGIDDVGALAAARALLVHFKPRGEVGDDLATFGAYEFVFVIHINIVLLSDIGFSD